MNNFEEGPKDPINPTEEEIEAVIGKMENQIVGIPPMSDTELRKSYEDQIKEMRFWMERGGRSNDDLMRIELLERKIKELDAKNHQKAA